MKSIFEKIYLDNSWTSESGPGSLPENASDYLLFLSNFIEKNEINTIFEIGCGNWNLLKKLNLNNKRYFGIDIVESIILKNKLLYSSGSITFETIDATQYVPNYIYDLILIKDTFQHLSYESINLILKNISFKYKCLMITNDYTTVNWDCKNGGWRALNMTLPPFELKPKEELIFQSVPFKKHTIVVL